MRGNLEAILENRPTRSTIAEPLMTGVRDAQAAVVALEQDNRKINSDLKSVWTDAAKGAEARLMERAWADQCSGPAPAGFTAGSAA